MREDEGQDEDEGNRKRRREHTEHHQGAAKYDSQKWQPLCSAMSSDSYCFFASRLAVGRNLNTKDLPHRRGRWGVY